MRSSRNILMLGALVAMLQPGVSFGAKKRSSPPPPTLSHQRAVELLNRGREARDEGRIGESIAFFGRSYDLALSDPHSGDLATEAVRQALDVADGLRIEIVSGDRQ